jgi:hypothetical protein
LKRLLLFFPAAAVLLAATLSMACGSDDSKSSSSGPAATTPSASNATPGATTTGASSAASASIPEKKISAKDYSYEFADTIDGGLVRLTMSNDGKETHQAQVVRLNPGVTQPQFQAALMDPDPSTIFKLVGFVGGPNAIPPGKTQSVVNNLTAGQYALLCFVTDDNDIPHLAKGMVKTFTVNAPTGTQAAAPETKDKVTLADFNFLGIDNLTAGKHTLEVSNGGPQPHEVVVLKLRQGVTVDQIKQLIASEGTGAAPPPELLQGGPPITEAGGLGALDKGTTGFADVTFETGDYAFLCFVPDATTGAPHAALGMIKGITVK